MIGGLLKATTGRLALFAAAGLFVGGLAVPTAKAADLGGDCCADLEERVAELEATTARKGNRKMSLTVSGQINTAMMYWKDGRDSDIYGVDNAVSRSAFQFDGSARINPDVSAGFSLVFATAGGSRSHHVSQDYNAAGDDGINTRVPYLGGDNMFEVEVAYWYLDSKSLGKVSVGRINGANAGATQVDLGGAAVVANSNIGLWQASFTTVFNNAPSAISWNTLMGGNNMSIAGLNRSNGIRYDTPVFGGFTAGASFGENDMWDVALRYAGEFSGFRLAGAIAYAKNACGTNDCNDNPDGGTVGPAASQEKAADNRKLSGSASLMHVASGLYVTGAYARNQYGCDSATAANCAGLVNAFTGGGLTTGQDRPDTTLLYLQGGVTKNYFGLGNTTVYGEWAKLSDGATGTVGNTTNAAFGAATNVGITDSQVKVWGIGVVQNIDAAAMELYLAYRKYDGSISAGACNVAACNTGIGAVTKRNIEDFDVVMGGARVKF